MANTDQSEGMTKKIKGDLKEAYGKITGDKKTENKGKEEQAEGQLQKDWGDLKDAV
ncbi:MAG: CsbD family protein [Pseudomonadota bacterium]